MKLTEIIEEPIVWTMTSKVMKLHPIHISIMQYGTFSTSWHRGALLNITKMPRVGADGRPSVTDFDYNVHYHPSVGPTNTFTLTARLFEKLKLYKDHEGRWTLSDRKPEPDDEL